MSRDLGRRLLSIAAIGLAAHFLTGCGGGGGGGGTTSPTSVSGTITGGGPVAGATIYLVPASSVVTTPIDGDGVRAGTTEGYDEPLEDLVAASGATFQSATTAANGAYTLSNVTSGTYYFYVKPAATDTDHLPGGNKCRIALSSSAFLGTTVDVTLSSKPPATATYIGSTRCLTCHPEEAGEKYTAHRLGFCAPGQPTGTLQDKRNFPNFDDGTDHFLAAAGTANYANGTRIYFGDYVGTRGFDKFEVYEDNTKITQVLGSMYLWKDTTNSNTHMITIVNTYNGTDPNSPLHLPVGLTYGGAVYKQRHLVEIPGTLAAGRTGLYPLLQFQSYPGISQGLESNYDRSRSKWRDYHLDWYFGGGTDAVVGTGADDLLKAPSATNTFQAQCAGCHSTGYRITGAQTASGEWPVDAVTDANGVYDIDGDGQNEEVNLGCEGCHGPGSAHETANSHDYIIDFHALTPSRANQVCGFCHDRPNGNGTGSGLSGQDTLFNAANEIPLPGISRADLLANHTSQKGPSASEIWSDKVHSIKHHQQYTDFIKSKHYRNDRQLVTCYDCHDTHADRSLAGLQEYPHQMTADPDDTDSTLCARCHALDLNTHTEQETGDTHAGQQTKCYQCHMPRIARSGPGHFGKILTGFAGGATTGVDQDEVYWMNDISSHVFDFASKQATGVAGVAPSAAMPASYTDRCGACHNVDNIQF